MKSVSEASQKESVKCLRRESYLSATRVKNGSKQLQKRQKTQSEIIENQLNVKKRIDVSIPFLSAKSLNYQQVRVFSFSQKLSNTIFFF